MDGQVTSPQSPGVWKQFGAFLRRPVLPEQATGIRAAALAPLGKLFALDLLLMTAMIAFIGLLTALGLEMPSHLLGELELSPLLIAFILVGAPLGEELLFRGWLSGKPGHVGAILVVLGAAIAMVIALDTPLLLLVILIGGIALALFVLWRLRVRPPMPFFARHFRWFYLFSTAAFASVHLTNFSEGAALILLPLTLPQFVLGLILGYARVRFGLWSSMLLHAAHNSLFVGLILAGAG